MNRSIWLLAFLAVAFLLDWLKGVL